MGNHRDNIDQNRIVISYRRQDSADITGRIYDRLVLQFGRDNVFKDVDTIPYGVDFRQAIGNAVAQSSIFLVVIGDRWLGVTGEDGGRRIDNPNDFVRIEVETALQRDVRLIPLLVRGASMPSEAELPETMKALTYRNAIPIRNDPDFHNDMSRLIQSIGDVMGRITQLGVAGNSNTPTIDSFTAARVSDATAKSTSTAHQKSFKAGVIAISIVLLCLGMLQILRWYEKQPVKNTLSLDKGTPANKSETTAEALPRDESAVVMNQQPARKPTNPDIVARIAELDRRLQRVERVIGGVVDKTNGMVALIGTESNSQIQVPLTVEDVAFCVHWAKHGSGEELGCAIESSADDGDETLLQVRYFGGIKNTHLGFLLFQADRCLKEYSLGQRMNGQTIHSTVRIYPNMLQKLQDRNSTSGSLLTRYWFKTNPLLEIAYNGEVGIVKNTGIAVGFKEMNLEEGQYVSARDVDPACQAFAQGFTESFSEFAQEEPTFAALSRIVQVLAVAKWLSESDVTDKIEWVADYATKNYPTPTQMPKIKIAFEQRQVDHNGAVISSVIRFIGGVSIGAPPQKIIRDDKFAREIKERLSRATLSAHTDVGDVVTFDLQGIRYVGLVLIAPNRL